MMHLAYIDIPNSMPVFSSGFSCLFVALGVFLGVMILRIKQIYGFLKRRLKPIPVETQHRPTTEPRRDEPPV